MEVIIIESEAFYKLLELAVNHLNTRITPAAKSIDDKISAEWLTIKEAMKILPYRSKTKWQELRDKGDIMFSQFGRKILYNRESLFQYVKKNEAVL